MRWEKLGIIFNAEEYGFVYTKSPQAVIFDNYIRVYFSTCIQDGKKLISEVAFVDFDKGFKNIIRVSQDVVIPRGQLGCFDEHGIFPFSPIRINDKIYGYISGWSRRVSVSVDTGIGLAISDDNGETFKRVGNGPVLTASIEEPFLIIDGYVKYINSQFHMWYIYGTDWKVFENGKEPDRIYKIGHAISNDGIHWIKEGRQIISDSYENEAQALPCVIELNHRYHMFFCYRKPSDFRNNPKRSYRIGYAYSDDLSNWIRNDENVGIDVSDTGWDSEMLCYPNVFEVDGSIYMLYNGNHFGKYGFGLAKLHM